MADKKDLMKEMMEYLEKARNRYIVPSDVEVEPLDKNKEMVMCTLLIEAMEDFGASHDEMMSALIYCGIVIDADKYHLDWRKAYDDYAIDALCEAYITPNIIKETTDE